MKQSELTVIDSYRLTPGYWGETCIMIDEEEVVRSMTELFSEDTTPDEDENDPAEDVQIATAADGTFYCVQPESHGRSHGNRDCVYPATYRRCDNPDAAVEGLLTIHGNRWESFDDEEDGLEE